MRRSRRLRSRVEGEWRLIAERVYSVVRLPALGSAEITLRLLFTLYSLLFTLWIFNYTHTHLPR